MKVGIFGTGDVGQTLGRAFVALGHEAMLGSRSPSNEKSLAWAKETGPLASAGTFTETARFGDIVVLATLGTATEEAVLMGGVENFAGKLVLDTTNPLDFSSGLPMLSIGHTDSLGEQIQRVLPEAKVVKAFNTVGHGHMFRPSFPDGPPSMFYCGNDEGAKRQAEALLKDFGWEPLDVGGIELSRTLEPLCILWVHYGIRSSTWNHAFKLLRK